MIKVAFKGGLEIEQALEELGRATAKNVTRQAARKALKPFVQTAQQLAPMDKGFLQKSIVIGPLSRRQASEAKQEGKTGVFVYAGTTDPNGVRHEFGTKHDAPHPFMRPAWDQRSPQMLDDFGREIWAAIERAIKRKANKAAKRR